MIKTMVAVWCNYTETRCPRHVTGDDTRQALNYAKRNGWYMHGHVHLCPFHKPRTKGQK